MRQLGLERGGLLIVRLLTRIERLRGLTSWQGGHDHSHRHLFCPYCGHRLRQSDNKIDEARVRAGGGGFRPKCRLWLPVRMVQTCTYRSKALDELYEAYLVSNEAYHFFYK